MGGGTGGSWSGRTSHGSHNPVAEVPQPTVEATPVAASVIDHLIQRAQAAHRSGIATGALFGELKVALAELEKARKTAADDKAPHGKPEGGQLLKYLEDLRQNRARVEQCLARVRALDAVLLRGFDDRAALFAALASDLSRVGSESEILDPTKRPTPRVRAAHKIGKRILEIVQHHSEGGRDNSAIESARKQATSDTTTVLKHPAGDRKRFETLIDGLQNATFRAIDIYEKTRLAKEGASDAVAIVSSLDHTVLTEPQKPTAEEVGRYLHEIDLLARQQIPAQRQAAELVLTFRKYLSALDDAIKDMAPAVRKTSHLEALALTADDEAVVVGGRQVLEVLRIEQRDLVRLADDWVSRKYDNSTPVTERFDDELEIMEQLELQVRNLGNAVANKSIAKAKYDQLKDLAEERQPAAPGFYFNGSMDFEDMLKTAESHLKAAAELAARVDKQNAIKMVAFDAYEARRERARQVAIKLAGIATTIERTLAHPVSDELRVRFFAIRKLHDLNGGYSRY